MAVKRKLFNDVNLGGGYSSAGQLAEELAAARPTADPMLEQFHMNHVSMLHQLGRLQAVFDRRRVLFLGDDDHMSILLAAFGDIQAAVVEIDDRVVDSLRCWAERLALRDFDVLKHDIRLPLNDFEKCESFYINPPYSSKNGGHGIRAWITRAMEACIPDCEGVIVLPADVHIKWIDENWLSTQAFLTDNGFRILACGANEHYYEKANDRGLKSSDLYVRRVDLTRTVKENPKPGTSLYR